MTVINAEYHKNYEAVYPPNCFVDFNNKKYMMKTVYKYRLKILNEYWHVGTKGFAVRKSIGNENPILEFRKSDSKTWYNSNENKIVETRK